MATTVCVLFTGMLKMNNSKLKPDKKSVPIWIILLIGSIFILFATKERHETSLINDKFYSFVKAMENIVLILLNLQKKTYKH